MSTLVEAHELGFAYGGRGVLSGLNLAVKAGSRVGLAGPNGCGKSTLLWCLLGLRRPSVGSVKRNGRIAAVFQNPEDQLFMPTLMEDLTLPLLNRGAARALAEEEGRAALAALGLEQLAGVEASRLSLGQRKRAVIAAALVQAPDLLVLDEPTSELDPRSARQLVETLNGLDCARLIASHDMEFLRRTTDALWILDEGRIAISGRTEDVLADGEALLRHGLA